MSEQIYFNTKIDFGRVQSNKRTSTQWNWLNPVRIRFQEYLRWKWRVYFSMTYWIRMIEHRHRLMVSLFVSILGLNYYSIIFFSKENHCWISSISLALREKVVEEHFSKYSKRRRKNKNNVKIEIDSWNYFWFDFSDDNVCWILITGRRYVLCLRAKTKLIFFVEIIFLTTDTRPKWIIFRTKRWWKHLSKFLSEFLKMTKNRIVRFSMGNLPFLVEIQPSWWINEIVEWRYKVVKILISKWDQMKIFKSSIKKTYCSFKEGSISFILISFSSIRYPTVYRWMNRNECMEKNAHRPSSKKKMNRLNQRFFFRLAQVKEKCVRKDLHQFWSFRRGHGPISFLLSDYIETK